jgi:hypothetical protein
VTINVPYLGAASRRSINSGQSSVPSSSKRLDKNPHAMRQRRETAEHPFGTLKVRMGATHFLMKRLSKVATEMALHVLAYNLTRVKNIIGIQPLMAAIRA